MIFFVCFPERGQWPLRLAEHPYQFPGEMLMQIWSRDTKNTSWNENQIKLCNGL